MAPPRIPRDSADVTVHIDGHDVRLTNLHKVFWQELGITKGDLLQHYLDVSTVLLPHVRNRAMVMKRYPNGASGEFFFMKRAPTPRPDWIEICPIEHGPEKTIDFPMVQDRASLLWVGASISISGSPRVTMWTSQTMCTSTSIPEAGRHSITCARRALS